jgi:2-polyprenyl-6-methoxyphenol hydroxylase-like FAD-dependent oxidoreductase
MSNYDVVVVGGRVAGASTALLLARSGLRVALVDRGSYGSDALSTHALMRAGVLQLARWGLLGDVVASGASPVHRTVFHYSDGETVRVSIKPRAGVDALYAPRRYILDRLLVDAAAEAGVDVWHRTRMTRPLTASTGRVTGIEAETSDGRTLVMPAALTVGADGVRSTMAAEVGAPVVRYGSSTGSVLFRYLADLPTEGYEWMYAGAAGAGLIPTNDGATCVFVSTTPARMHQLRRSGVETTFATLLGAAGPAVVDRVLSARPSSPVRGWAGLPGYIRRSWGPGWALVGDAGYFKDPITAHGITDALRDAELLAEQVVSSMGGTEAEDVALRTYQDTRDRLSRGLFAASDEVAAYDWDADGIRALLRRVSSAMSDEVDHLQALPGGFVLRPPQTVPDDGQGRDQ